MIVTPVCIWNKSNCFSIPCIIVFTSFKKKFFKTILYVFDLKVNYVSILPTICVFIRSWNLLDLSVCFRLPRFCLFCFFVQNFYFRLYLLFGCLPFYHGLCLSKSWISVMFLFGFFLEFLCFCRMLHSFDMYDLIPVSSMLFQTETWTTELYEVFWPETTEAWRIRKDRLHVQDPWFWILGTQAKRLPESDN